MTQNTDQQAVGDMALAAINEIELPAPGGAMRALYQLDPELGFLNHGSYGALAWPLAVAQQHWRRHIELNPDGFIRDEWPDIWQRSRQVLADYVGTRAERLGLVANATAGLQAAAFAAPLEPGQRILINNHCYAAFENILRHVAGLRQARVDKLTLADDAGLGDALITRLTEELAQGDVGLVAIDHITSPTALMMPVKRVVELCRAQDVPVLVDGAHAPGMVTLRLDGIDPDWYVGNAHKWLGAPRGTAFVRVSDRWASTTHSPLISHGYGQGFSTEYLKYGTIDFSAWASLPAVIGWHRRLADHGTFSHAAGQLQQALADLAAGYDFQPLVPGGNPHAAPLMASIRLPARFDEGDAEQLRRRLRQEHGIVTVFIPWQREGQRCLLWRLSAYGYTDADEIARAARVIGGLDPLGA